MITLPPDLVPPVNSEVRKVYSLRWCLALGVLLPAIALVSSTVTSLMAGPADPNSALATGAATIGLYLALTATILAAAVFGAAGAGGEFRYRTMPVTSLFTADRDRLAAAKLLVTGAYTLAVAVVVELVAFSSLLAFGRGKFEFGTRLLTVFGTGLLAAVCWSLLGAGLGLLLRQSTGAVTLILGWLLVIEPLIWLVANGIGLGGVVTLLPGSATVATVAAGSFPDSDILAPTPAAFVVLLLWTIGIAGAGWWQLRSRDM
ncbi:ABC transporter permease [Nocardia sp. NPDC050793]|uniref:ABC transporter permease n=1 Tax=Nocardia sp. NPDC050793 TaxID=3155159 RepID=UPI0033CA67B3